MKVTALIPDELVKEVREYSGGNTITESLILALNEWLSLKKVQSLNDEISRKPLEFAEGFSAYKVRKTNRGS